jgi:uncharacterized membrane protein
MKLTWRGKFSLLPILLAGTAMRLFRLGADSLWYDETVSVFLAGSPTPELIRHTAGDIHPPGYYLLLRGWLILLGYPIGHADLTGHGLEFAAGFFSLAFGVILIALVYALARRATDHRIALIAAALVAFSPYNVWYSQEVRMYTLAATLGTVVLYALLRVTSGGHGTPQSATPALAPERNAGANVCKPQHLHLRRSAAQVQVSAIWWTVYTVAAAAGMYTLYYFAFLLIVLNLWVVAVLIGQARGQRRTGLQSAICPQGAFGSNLQSAILPWLLANAGVLLLYAPWIPIAWRQATEPPVPPWRTASALLAALRESWTALSLGQSAPNWLWPALLLTLGLYIAGLIALATSQVSGLRSQVSSLKSHASPCHGPRTLFAGLVTLSLLFLATFGSLALILLASAATPLYHVRYLFTYSPAFYVVLAAGLNWLEQTLRVLPRPLARRPGRAGRTRPGGNP